MTHKDIEFSKLREPFEPNQLEWRVQQSGMSNNAPWAMVLTYVTNRAIQDRLDDVVGPGNWKNTFETGPDGGVLCGIAIKIGDEWVSKYDGASNTDVEEVKGGLSNAMKRAAVQWGIGRYLYDLPSQFVKPKAENGDHRIKIKDSKTNQIVFTGYWDTPKLPDWALPKKTT